MRDLCNESLSFPVFLECGHRHIYSRMEARTKKKNVETKPRTSTSIDAITVIVLQPCREIDQPNNPLHSDIRFIPRG
jgi:hypothetical protein